MDNCNTSAGQKNDNTTSNGVLCSVLSALPALSLGSMTFECSQGRAVFRGIVGLAGLYVGYKLLTDRNCQRLIAHYITNRVNDSPPTTQAREVCQTV